MRNSQNPNLNESAFYNNLHSDDGPFGSNNNPNPDDLYGDIGPDDNPDLGVHQEHKEPALAKPKKGFTNKHLLMAAGGGVLALGMAVISMTEPPPAASPQQAVGTQAQQPATALVDNAGMLSGQPAPAAMSNSSIMGTDESAHGILPRELPGYASAPVAPAVSSPEQVAQVTTFAAPAPMTTQVAAPPPAIAAAAAKLAVNEATPSAAAVADTSVEDKLRKQVDDLTKKVVRLEQQTKVLQARLATASQARQKTEQASSRPSMEVARVPASAQVNAEAGSEKPRVLGVTMRPSGPLAIMDFAGVKQRYAVGDTVPSLGQISDIDVAGGAPAVRINGVLYR